MRLALLTIAMLLASCITGSVQKRTLEPAVMTAWEGVRADAERGGLEAYILEQWDIGLETGMLVGLDIFQLEDAAIEGVERRLANQEIGPIGAAVMRDRARAFSRAIEELRRPIVMADRPLVISRSSWATSPPPAIAARTYR